MGKALPIESLNGLHPLSTGARVSFGKGKPTVTDGPFVEAKSKDEVVKWAQKCPAESGRFFDQADFAIAK